MMMMFHRRTKIVSIRLSDAEYDRLQEVRAVTGARSVSDVARDAMWRGLGTGGDGELLRSIVTLATRMSGLQDEVSRLSAKVGP